VNEEPEEGVGLATGEESAMNVSTLLGELWEKASGDLRKRVGERSFDLWLAHARPRSLLRGTLTVAVPNLFIRNWLEEHYADDLRKAAESAVGTRVEIDLVVDGSLSKEMRETRMKALETLEAEVGSRLGAGERSAASFASLVELPGNRVAFRAARQCVTEPGRLYNPLFLHGQEGAGKTELLRATQKEFHKRWPGKSTLYLTLEQFKNRFIFASRKHLLDRFRDGLHALDLLVLDDLQTLSGRIGTQAELESLLRDLLGRKKQVIVASRLHPREIPALTEGLPTILLSGMSSLMELPSPADLVQVLSDKATRLRTPVSKDVLSLIVQSTGCRPGKAVQALRKIVAFATLSGKPITVDLITGGEVDAGLVEDQGDKIRGKIEDLVTWHFKVDRELLYSKRKFKSVQQPRRLCMYLLRECADVSHHELARLFGNRSLVSAVSSVRRVEREIATDPRLRGLVTEFTRRVREEA